MKTDPARLSVLNVLRACAALLILTAFLGSAMHSTFLAADTVIEVSELAENESGNEEEPNEQELDDFVHYVWERQPSINTHARDLQSAYSDALMTVYLTIPSPPPDYC